MRNLATLDGPDSIDRQRDKGNCVPRQPNKLDFKSSPIGIDVYDHA
jgi:hypothetical protein